MNWYLKVIRDNYANFEGRARRTEYWMFTLFNLLVFFGLGILMVIFGVMDLPSIMFVIYGLMIVYSLAIFVPTLAVVVRRLHDTGKSGWMYLITFIPFIGGIWILVLMATEGDHGSNEYGEDPKAIGDQQFV